MSASSGSARSTAKLQRIVVGTDFSDAAETAVRVAVELAAAHGAELTIVNAVDPIVTTLEVPVEELLKDVREQLIREAKPIEQRGVKVATQMRIGKPWWAICETARENGADLIIVASHGRTGLARMALGGTADRVVRASGTPVLVIPRNYNAPPAQWKTALVGIDFSEESALAAKMAVRLLESSSAARCTLALFHTVALAIEFRGADVPVALPEHWDHAEAAAMKRVEAMAAPLRSMRLDVKTVTFRGYPSDGILHEAHALNADFIAVGTHGRGTVNRVLLGSVAESVLHRADRPVLTVRHPTAQTATHGKA